MTLFITSPGEIQKCPLQQKRCARGPCVPAEWFCDGEVDCPNKDDEIHCGKLDIKIVFLKIKKNFEHLQEIHWVGTLYDAISVPALSVFLFSGKCESKKFRCNNGECISEYLRCDGTPDCTGQEDEFNCCKEKYPTWLKKEAIKEANERLKPLDEQKFFITPKPWQIRSRFTGLAAQNYSLL